MRDFHPDDDFASPEEYVPQSAPDDFDPGLPNQLLDFVLRSESTEVVDTDLFEKYYRNRSLSDAAYWSLVISYSVLIIAGSIGNLLVILAVVNNKSKCL